MTSRSKSGGSTRRTEGVRPSGRAARVVEEVLRRTAEQLTRVGYAALRVEDVAALSGVNKTTIYRRWPTRAELVAAALRRAKAAESIDTGSLEGDVLAWLRATRAFATSVLGAGIIRVIQSERDDPELGPIARRMREEHRALRRQVVRRAIARGELPKGTSADLVADLIFAPTMTRLVNYGEPVSDAYVRRLLEVVIRGTSDATPTARGPSGARTRRASV